MEADKKKAAAAFLLLSLSVKVLDNSSMLHYAFDETCGDVALIWIIHTPG